MPTGKMNKLCIAKIYNKSQLVRHKISQSSFLVAEFKNKIKKFKKNKKEIKKNTKKQYKKSNTIKKRIIKKNQKKII